MFDETVQVYIPQVRTFWRIRKHLKPVKVCTLQRQLGVVQPLPSKLKFTTKIGKD